jgi:2'-5' RNA ligase
MEAGERGAESLRLFIAAGEPEAETRQRLARLRERLGAAGRTVRWVPPEQMHLTLLFLGATPAAMVPPIGEEMAAVAAAAAPFELEVRGVGAFARGRGIGVIWAGVRPCEPPAALQAALAARLAPAPESAAARPFTPHLTLGRVRRPRPDPWLEESLRKLADFEGGRLPVRELRLFRSELTPAGAVHTCLLAAPLGGGRQSHGSL